MLNTYQLIPVGEKEMVAEGKCLQTGKVYRTSPFTGLGWMRWKKGGEMIQAALPELNADDREFLISGFSPDGWIEIYGTEDEVD